MDNNKINEIQDLLEDEEFKVDNFEFKLWNIRSSWMDSLFLWFIYKYINLKKNCVIGILFVFLYKKGK